MVIFAGLWISNSPAFAITAPTGSSFGSGPYAKFTDGLKINGKPFDISRHSQTIQTQILPIDYSSNVSLKIYHVGSPKSLLHLVIYLNLKGNHTHPIYSDTWIDFSKTGSVAVHDPHKIFQSITGKASYDTQFMYINFLIIPQKPLDTSHIIIRTWDNSKIMTESDILNAIKISYH